MTLAARLVTLFPGAIVAGALGTLVWLCAAPGPLPLLALVGVLYLAPVIAFRMHQALWPIAIGDTPIGERRYVPWWGAHQIQVLYIAVPQLEAILRVIPGLYSAWLRLWGARVGKAVYWTPLIDIGDRSLLEIGDGVVFGHRATLYSHLISPKKGQLILFVKPICIGRGAFVGAGTVLGPGVLVHSGKLVPAGKIVYPNQEIK